MIARQAPAELDEPRPYSGVDVFRGSRPPRTPQLLGRAVASTSERYGNPRERMPVMVRRGVGSPRDIERGADYGRKPLDPVMSRAMGDVGRQQIRLALKNLKC
jgi:hypothetical protein